ncbi:MAG: hypothetical protein CMD36_06905, partial [Flavobacteriales bacterium]|nr:hypothetical protein [Flavobacteriales bacterium]
HLPGNDYTVPAGKNLYITNHSGFSNGENLKIDGLEMNVNNKKWNKFIIVGSGSIVSTPSNTSSSWSNFNGYLVDANVTPITWHLPGNDYTVPAGKHLYITAHSGFNNGENLKIDGLEMNVNNKEWTNVVIAGSGSIVSTPSNTSSSWSNFNGYLVDENYFAGCGGTGGGSSSVTIDYDSLASLISSDTTFITNVGGGIGGGGCDILFPEGLDGEAISFKVNSSNKYTVPAGKRLYVTNNYGTGTYFNIVGVGNISYETNHEESHSLAMPIILNSGEQLQSSNNNWVKVNGILVDENPSVQAISVQVNSSNKYTVPVGKRLYVTNNYGTGTYFNIVGVGNISYETNHERSHSLAMPIILNSGEQLESGNNNWVTVNGYLVDEDYFAGCGGVGGGSSSVTIDYDSLASIISADSTFITNIGGGIGGGGCDILFPDGLIGESFTLEISGASNYNVPSGKRLYIFRVYGSSVTVDGLYTDNPNRLPLILNENQQLALYNSSGTIAVYGFLADKSNDVEAITMQLNGFSTYSPPPGKRLFIFRTSQTMPVVDGFAVSPPLTIPIILDSQNSISGGGSTIVFNGYLVDINYFDSCGGGGSSSSTSTTNNQINNYNNILNQSITSGSFNYIFSNYPNSVTYTVPSGKIMKITSTQSANYGPTNPVLINGNQWTSNAAIPELLSEGTQLEIQFNSSGDYMNLQYILFDN